MKHPRDDLAQFLVRLDRILPYIFCGEIVIIAKLSLCTQFNANTAKCCSYKFSMPAVLMWFQFQGTWQE